MDLHPTKCSSMSLAGVSEILAELTAGDRSQEVITALHRIPAREAEWAPLPDWIRPELADAYRAKGVVQLYSHQAQAVDAASGASAGHPGGGRILTSGPLGIAMGLVCESVRARGWPEARKSRGIR